MNWQQFPRAGPGLTGVERGVGGVGRVVGAIE